MKHITRSTTHQLDWGHVTDFARQEHSCLALKLHTVYKKAVCSTLFTQHGGKASKLKVKESQNNRAKTLQKKHHFPNTFWLHCTWIDCRNKTDIPKIKQCHNTIWAVNLFLGSVWWTSGRSRVEEGWVMGPSASTFGDVQLWPCKKLWGDAVVPSKGRMGPAKLRTSHNLTKHMEKSTECSTDDATVADWMQ